MLWPDFQLHQDSNIIFLSLYRLPDVISTKLTLTDKSQWAEIFFGPWYQTLERIERTYNADERSSETNRKYVNQIFDFIAWLHHILAFLTCNLIMNDSFTLFNHCLDSKS